MQKKRDAAAANQAQEIGTHGHGFQQAPQQHRSDLDSASTVPSAGAQDYPQQSSGTYENVSTVTDALRFGYNPRKSSQLYRGSDVVRQEGDTMMIDTALGSSVGERGTVKQLNTGYTRPLVVSSPFTGPVPPDSEDEADVTTPKTTISALVAKPAPEIIQPSLAGSEDAVVTPRPASSTPVAKPTTEVVQPSLTQSEDDVVTPELRPSTPVTKSPPKNNQPSLAQPGDNVITPELSPSTSVAKTVPEITKPNLAQSQPELLKGPAGITILPAYSTRTPELAPEIASNAYIASNPELGPPPKLYPPPPRATGSPNDRYRQVPRSGGAIRDPSHRPFQYQYGGPDQQFVGGFLPPAYNQQPRYPYPQRVVAQSQYYSPARAFNQTGYAFSQNQLSGFEHRQLFDPNTSSGVANRGRYRGGRGRGRGGQGKAVESKRYSNRTQHQTGRRPASSGEGQYVPLDPALEENQTYSRQNTYGGGQSRYTGENIGQFQMQNQYAAALQYDNNRGLGNGNGNGRGYGDSCQYRLPAPLAFKNENPTNHTPSTFAADEQEPFPDFDPDYNPEMDMMATAQSMIAPPARQPFVPSPVAAEFTPRITSVRRDFSEQGQVPGQEQALANQLPHFQRGHAMMPLAPSPFGGVMLMPVPTPAEMLTRLGLPHLTPYERPRQVVPMPTPMPPMGEFTPPRTRKFGRQAANKMHWTDEANENAILDDDDDDEDDVGVNVGRAGDVDAKQERKKEASKLKKKAKKAKLKRGGGLGFSRKMEARAAEGEVGGQGGTEATTMTAASAPNLAVATTTAGAPTLATAPALATALILAAATTPAVAPIVAAAPTVAAASTTRMSYAAILAAAPAPAPAGASTLAGAGAPTTSHAATLAMAPLPTPAASPTLTAAEFESRLEVIIEEDDMMGEG